LRHWAASANYPGPQPKDTADLEAALIPYIHQHRLPRGEFVEQGLKHCHQVGKAERKRWEETADMLDPERKGVPFGAVRRQMKNLGEEWWRASQVLALLTNLARASCGFEDLFDMMDTNHDGTLSEQEFDKVIQQVVGHHLTGLEMHILFKALDLDDVNYLTPNTIQKGLEIVDTWALTLHGVASLQDGRKSVKTGKNTRESTKILFNEIAQGAAS